MPYLAQHEALCGGAAAAMVLRYWGAADVQPEDFAPLLDLARRGISTGRLTDAVAALGFEARPLATDAASVARHVALGRPIVALIDAGGGRLHYVVLLGWANDRVLLHDPAVGPFRVWTERAFLEAWRATGGFALLVLPGETSPAEATTTAEAAALPPGPCQSLVDAGVALGRGADPEAAVPSLTAAAELCPDEARPLQELAGVRFRQERWEEAAALAARACRLAPADAGGWRLLGASHFLADQRAEALEAWNHADEPRVDRIRIEGLSRTRQQVALAYLGLNAREILTSDRLARAARRLAELPSATSTALAYRPVAEGRVDVVASVSEPGVLDPLPVLAVRGAIGALTEREVRVPFYSLTGGGDRLEVGGRFAPRRPALWAALASPRTKGLSGVFTLTGLWDRQTYAVGAAGSRPLEETRRSAALDWSTWSTSTLRFHAGAGLDRWPDRPTDASLRAGAEWRLRGDHVAATADLAAWLPLGSAHPFNQVTGGLMFRSRTRSGGPLVTARVEGARASARAPLGLWPGAGTGTGRPWLLRAHPLLSDGVVSGEAFGRGLLHASIELETPPLRLSVARLAVAVFSDWARAWDRPGRRGAGPGLTALGAGLRVRLPGSSGALRLDAATRVDGGGLTVSADWMAAWPRQSR